MAHVTDLIKEAYTTDPSGNVALRTTVEGDQNLNGGHILNDQTTTNMMSKGTVFYTNGVDAKIVATSQAMTYPYTMGIKFKYKSTGAKAAVLTLGDASEADVYYGLLDLDGTGALNILRRNTTEVSTSTGQTLSDGTHYGIIVDFPDATSFNVYIGGALVSAQTGLTSVTMAAGLDELRWGLLRTASPTQFAKMEVSETFILNYSPTADEVKDINSGDFDFKWQYGSQTSIVTGDDSDMDTVGNWVAQGSATVTGGYDSLDAGHDKTLRIEAGDGSNERGALDQSDFTANTVIGKEYIIEFDYKYIETTDMTTDGQVDFAGTTMTDLDRTAVTWTKYSSSRIIVNTTSALVLWVNTSTGHADNEVLIDNVILKPVGAVALYDQTSMTDTQWLDLAQGNHGDITGAERLQPKPFAVDNNGVPYGSVTSGITANTNSAQGDTPLVSHMNQKIGRAHV